MPISDDNQTLLEKLQHLETQDTFHRQILADILAFSTRLTHHSDLKTLYNESNTLALNILKLDFSTLMMLSDDGKALVIRDAIGFPSSMIDSFSLLEGHGLSTFIVKQKKAATVQDFQTEKRFEVPPVVFKENIVSAIAVPMLIGDTVFGVLIGHTKTKRIFTPEEIDLYQSIANQSAVAIKNVMHFESLKDSEKRFRTLIDRAGDAIFLADMNGRLMDVNKMACQSLEYTREELLNMTVFDIDPLAKENRHQEGLWANMSSDQYVTINSQHCRKDGSLFPVEIKIGLLALQNTNYILGFARDITERKQAEEYLLRTMKELQDANAELAQFNYVVAHDLKAPIRAMSNYTAFLKVDLASVISGEQKAYLTRLRQTAVETGRIIEDLLKMAKIGSQKQQAEEIELGDFMGKLVSSMDLPPDIEISMDSDWPIIMSYPNLLRQVFLNLIENAWKYNIVSPKRITIGCLSETDESITCCVRDNGIGIAAEYHEQIFRLFERLHSPKKYSGTGIGLAIVKKAINKLGGTIRVESTVGKGSTFYVSLPVDSTE